MEPGFVYVLTNPSLHGLVKVGRTEQDPSGRADELSGTTGLPTPFVLAFKRFFADCESAEEFVYAFLNDRSHRISANRQFLRVSLDEVIEAIVQAPGEGSPARAQKAPPWKAVFDEAEAYYYGLGDHARDRAEALKLYKQAAKLGSVAAYRSLGTMYANGWGCPRSFKKGLEYFKEGVRRGDVTNYAEMAFYFCQVNPENTVKCWGRFFAEMPKFDDCVMQLLRYFEGCRKGQWRPVHWEALVPVLPALRDFVEGTVADARREGWDSLQEYELDLREIVNSIESGNPPVPVRT